MARKPEKNRAKGSTFRERLANWIATPAGPIRRKLSTENQEEIRHILLSPVSWFKGVDTPEGHVTPWELAIFMVSTMLTTGGGGFSGRLDFLFKEYYHISPNKMSVAGVISSLWDAFNDPILGSWMDRKKMGPKQWRFVMRLAAVTGHTLVLFKMINFGGNMTEMQHLVTLVVLNCIQDIIGTLDAVAGQKLRAGISPYTQQRTRTQVWTSIGNSLGFTVSAIPNVLMGLQNVFGWNDYQIIVVGTAIMLPFNICGSMMITFIRQRVDFKYAGKPANSLPYDMDQGFTVPEAEEKKAEQAEQVQAEQEKLEAEMREAEQRYRTASAARDEMLANMTREERRAWKKEEKAKKKAEKAEQKDFRKMVENGEIKIDPETGEPKLSVGQSFAVLKYNKYFIWNTVANFITVFTPSVDSSLIYRYLVPKLNVGGKEVTGEIFLTLRDYIVGVPLSFTKPFSRQFVNLCGGPLRVHKIHSACQIVASFIKFVIGINKFWKLALQILIDALLYVIQDMDSVAGTMMTYEMLDMVELKTGFRTEGVTNSINGLFAKIVTNNIGTVTGNAFLQWTGYKGGYKESGEALPTRFVKYMWPMFTLTGVFDNLIFLIARSMYKHTPEDARRIEDELIEMRKHTGRENVAEKQTVGVRSDEP